MPPVFGPVSPSPTRLKSCAGSSGETVRPSVTANSDTSGPARYCSTTTRGRRAACASAASRSVVTTTPLPAASPSSFTTYGLSLIHISEPTRLLSISYAVFCLKKKKKKQKQKKNLLYPKKKKKNKKQTNTQN